MRLLFSLLIIFFISTPAWAVTRYARTDGGTGTQCDGLTDAAYPPSSGTACAVNHPNWLIPPNSTSAISTARAAQAGDTVVIGTGSYRIGCQGSASCADATVNMQTSNCNTSASYDCYSRAVPNNVTVVGCTTAGCGCTYNPRGYTTCTTARPELWGAGNVREVINVSGSSGVTLKDLEITDHANCNVFTPFTCRLAGDMSNPASLSAQFGIDAASASNLTITGVNNHGVGYEAMRANNVNTMTITGSNFDYAAIGMNNDTNGSCTTCGLTGTITIEKSSFNGHGCIEDWQNDGTIVANTCCSQEHGCSSAEGIGLGNTGGNWVINDSDFSYNTADGLDMLYHNRGIYSGGLLTIKRSRAEGNAGNPWKASNATIIEDSFAISNCGYFHNQPFTYSSSNFDHCRAGAAIALEFHSNDTRIPVISSNTIVSNADVTINASGTCATGQNFNVKNNIIIGGRDWLQDNSVPGHSGGQDDNTQSFYDSAQDGGTCNITYVPSNNVCVGNFKTPVEVAPCSGTNSTSVTNAALLTTGTILQGPQSSPGYFNAKNYSSSLYLQSTSPAINRSDTSIGDSTDFNSFARGASWDSGAVELNSVPTGSSCGNGFRDSGEACEGADLNAQTCITQGYASGTLSCSASCTFNYSSCVATTPQTCGNSIIEGTETCDDGNTTNGDCCSSQCQTETSGIENLLTYTDTSPAGYLTITTNAVTIASMARNINATLYKDFGASYFTDFNHKFRVDWTSCVETDGRCLASVWAVTSSLYTNLSAAISALDGLDLHLLHNTAANGGTYQWVFKDSANGVDTRYTDTTPPSTRYVQIVRAGTTVTATLYSDAGYTSVLGTMTLLGVPTTAYRYFYAMMSYNDAVTDPLINYSVQDINVNASALNCGGGGGGGVSTGSGNAIMSNRCGALGRFNIP